MSEETLTFPYTGADWSGFCAALAYAIERGYSAGPMQRGCPVGLVLGKTAVSKWRNLSDEDRDALDGTITFAGGPRDGAAIVRLRAPSAGMFHV